MKEKLIQQIMEEVMKNVEPTAEKVSAQAVSAPETCAKPEKVCTITEFVGTAIGDTIGFVIANVDAQLLEVLNLEKKYRSIGILGSRTGAGPHIMAADEAVKATNTEIISVELARDTKGGAGHGSLIVFGAEDVSDARRAIEVALGELDRTFGDVYGNDSGHLEFQYTARASYACEKAFGAHLGKSFGLIVGAPAAIGLLISDVAVKAANVDIVGHGSPAQGTSYSNEFILMISGDSGAVRQSLIAAKEVGIKALEALGGPAPSSTVPYI